MAFKLVELFAEITARDAKFRKSMRDIEGVCKWTQHSLDKLGRVGRRLFIGLTAGATLALREFSQQDDAVNNLNATLASTGAGVERWTGRLQQAASRMQQLTTYSDEFILGLMTQGLNLGVSADKIEEVTRQAVGLAKALRMDVGTAMRYVALAHQGEFTMLRRYIPELRATTDKHKQLAIILRKSAQGWKQEEAATQTFSGTLKQLKNSLGDALEVIGAALAPAIIKVAKHIRSLVPGLIEWAKGHTKVIQSAVVLTAKIAILLILAPKIAAVVIGLSRAFGLMAAAMLGATAGPIGALIGAVIGTGGVIWAIGKAKDSWEGFLAALQTPLHLKIAEEIENLAKTKGLGAAQAKVLEYQRRVEAQPWWATGKSYREVPHPSGMGTQLRVAPSATPEQMEQWRREREEYRLARGALGDYTAGAKAEKVLGFLRSMGQLLMHGRAPGVGAAGKGTLGTTMDPTTFVKQLQQGLFKNEELAESKKHTGILGAIRDGIKKGFDSLTSMGQGAVLS